MREDATPRKVYLWSVLDTHTTARYFEKAIRKTGVEVYYGEFPDLKEISENDLVLLMDSSPKEWFSDYHRLPCPSIAYIIDTHLDFRYRALWVPFFDHVFVAQKDDLARFERSSMDWLPHACDPRLFCQRPVRDYYWEVGFVGQWGSADHPRHQFLKKIHETFQMNPQNQFYQPNEMAEVYSASRIVVNRSVKNDLNMRVFEAMASGALLVTDNIGNGLENLFKDGEDCIFYRSTEEAVEKIKYYLDHSEERIRIASHGTQKVKNQHTYDLRWEKILQAWRNHRTSMEAPIRKLASHEREELKARIAAAHGDPLAWWKSFRKSFWKPFLLVEGLRALIRFHRHKKHRDQLKKQ